MAPVAGSDAHGSHRLSSAAASTVSNGNKASNHQIGNHAGACSRWRAVTASLDPAARITAQPNAAMKRQRPTSRVEAASATGADSSAVSGSFGAAALGVVAVFGVLGVDGVLAVAGVLGVAGVAAPATSGCGHGTGGGGSDLASSGIGSETIPPPSPR